MSTMMRATEELIEDLKLLKEIKSTNGKVGTHATLLHELVKSELRVTRANTQSGYLPPGTVVMGPNDKPVTIKAISQGTVILSDGTYLLNGGSACFALLWLADNVSEFKGGACPE